MVGAGHWVLPALVTRSCCSATPAPTVPWQPGCQGTQVATEPRRPELGRHDEQPQRQEHWRGAGRGRQAGGGMEGVVGRIDVAEAGRHGGEGALGWRKG